MNKMMNFCKLHTKYQRDALTNFKIKSECLTDILSHNDNNVNNTTNISSKKN